MHYLKQEENNKTWYCTQEDIPKDKKGFIQPNKKRAIKSSATSASLIFYDEKKNRLFSKFTSGTYEFPYGFIWDIDGNSFDKCIFSPTDSYTDSKFFSEKKI